MWVEFLTDYDWRPPEKPNSHVAYKTGMIVFVRRQCGRTVLSRGIAKPSSKEESINGRQFD